MPTSSKQTTGATRSQTDIFNYLFARQADKTDDYSVSAVNDVGKTYPLGFATLADKVFTFDATPADGAIFSFINKSYYRLRIKPAAADSIYTSGAGYGIDLPDRGTFVMLQYVAANNNFDILWKTGGKVMIEGLVLYEPMDKMGFYRGTGSPYGANTDKTGKHACLCYANVFPNNTLTSVKFPPGCWQFDGTGDYVLYTDSEDWNIFSTQAGHKTISIRLSLDVTVNDYFINLYEDANNSYHLNSSGSDTLEFVYRRGGSNEIGIANGSLSIATWYWIVMIIDGAKFGLYLDGTQVGFDDSWTADAFTGSLFFGQDGVGSSFFDGKAQEFMVAFNNPYGAAPDAGLTDTIIEPVGPFQGIML